MANAELNVVISADGKQLAATMQKAEKDVQGLENELKDLTPAFDNVNKSLNKTAAELKTTAQSFQPLIKGVRLSDDALKKLPKSSNASTQSLINLGRVAQDAPFGFLGIANNINPLLESFQRLKAESGSTKTALKSLASGLMGAGGLGLAVSVISSLLIVFGDRLFKSSKVAEAAVDANKKYKESIESIFGSAGKEAAEVGSLIAVLKSETETRERKLAAIKELQRIQPEVFGSLKLEGNAVAGLDAAYKNYIENLRTVIAVKIKQAKLEQLITKQLEKQGQALTASEKSILDGVDAFKKLRSKTIGGDITPFALQLEKERKAVAIEGDKLTKDVESLFKDITELSSGVEIKIDKPKAETDKTFNNIISKAKEMAAFLKDTFFVVNYEFSPLDSKPVALAKAQAFLDEVSQGKLKFKADISIGTFSEPIRPEDIKKITTEFEDLLSRGVIIPPKIETDAGFINDDQIKLLDTFRAKFAAIGIQMSALKDIDLFKTDAAQLEAILKLKNEAANAASVVNGVLTPAFDDMFSAIKAGENPIKAFFEGIGQAVLQLIQKLIVAAIQALVIQAILTAAGLGGSGGSTGDIFKGLLGFKAEGGPVFANKPYVVGEKGPELFIPQGGGRIIPNNEMNIGLAGVRAGMQTVKVVGQVSGRSLRLVNARQQGFENRNT